jgi:hypothetical protein
VASGQTPVTDASGSSYQWLQSAQQASAAQAAGQVVYFQPVPGVFSPINFTPGTAGLPVYLKTPTTGAVQGG